MYATVNMMTEFSCQPHVRRRRIANAGFLDSFRAMSLPHPSIDQISLANVLAVLGDQTRLAVVGYLARNEGVAVNCGQFLDYGSKTNLSYHLAKLREAGVTRTEIRGTSRLISLRRADLDSRFPGLLDSIIASAIKLPFNLKSDEVAGAG
jgi:DNA-binding transcriptional ArsR family regulator